MIYSIRKLTFAAKHSLVAKPEIAARIFWHENFDRKKIYLKNWDYSVLWFWREGG